MIKFFSKGFICIWLMLQTAGCVHKQPIYPTLPTLTRPENYLQQVVKTAESYRHVSGIAKLKVFNPKNKFSTRTIFFLQRPHFIRLEMLGILNQPALFFLTDGKKLNLYVPSDNTFYSGDALPDNLAAIIGIKLQPQDIVQYFLGFPPVVDLENSKISWEQDTQYYLFEIIKENRTQLLWIDPQLKRIVKYLCFAEGEPQYEFSFSDFQTNEGLVFPLKIALTFNRVQTKITLRYEAIRLDPFSSDKFTFTPPPQAKHLPIEDFINNE